jgi:hypothetical protein
VVSDVVVVVPVLEVVVIDVVVILVVVTVVVVFVVLVTEVPVYVVVVPEVVLVVEVLVEVIVVTVVLSNVFSASGRKLQVCLQILHVLGQCRVTMSCIGLIVKHKPDAFASVHVGGPIPLNAKIRPTVLSG